MDELLSVLFYSASVGVSHDGCRLRNERDGERKGGRKKKDRTSRKSIEEPAFFLKCLMREDSKA